MPVCPCGVVTRNAGAATAHDRACGTPPKPETIRKRRERERQRAADKRVEGLDWRWQDEAACQHVPTDAFFRRDGEGAAEWEERAQSAKRVCGDCPVLGRCFAFALEARPEEGVWAGHTAEELERKRVKGQRTRRRVEAVRHDAARAAEVER